MARLTRTIESRYEDEDVIVFRSDGINGGQIVGNIVRGRITGDFDHPSIVYLVETRDAGVVQDVPENAVLSRIDNRRLAKALRKIIHLRPNQIDRVFGESNSMRELSLRKNDNLRFSGGDFAYMIRRAGSDKIERVKIVGYTSLDPHTAHIVLYPNISYHPGEIILIPENAEGIGRFAWINKRWWGSFHFP